MVWIDIVCCVIIVLLALLGLWRGFLKSIFKLCAWIAALLGAYFATGFIGDFIASNLEISGLTVKIICICVGFLVPFLLFSFIGHILNNAVKDSAISGVNRLLGAVFGVAKALIICFLFLSVIHLIPASGDLKQARNDAISYSAYKWSLEVMGFSSEEIDIIDMAEKKATEMADSAVEASKEAVEKEAAKAVDNAKQAAKDAAIKAVEGTTDVARDAVEKTSDKATGAAEKVKDVKDSAQTTEK
ncbi:MAG: CvpA family protein [Fibrobacter sp.]|nr:CvpA family protein [Fibrobacter sp.]